MLVDTNTIEYIIHFLLGGSASEEFTSTIGYTTDKSLYQQYKLVIHPSGFFEEGIYGTQQSVPALPLNRVEGTPVLFGNTKEELVGQTLILHADIIASTYFLISRYEEMIKPEVRDQHGRFPGKESLLYQTSVLNRPIVDEYGSYLRNKLRQQGVDVPHQKEGVRHVYLTHDVDSPFCCRSFRNIARETLRGKGFLFALKAKFGALENDPNYTFPWLFAEDNKLKQHLGEDRCTTIAFFKAGGNTPQDKPVYNLRSKDMQCLFDLCGSMQVKVGLHSSYHAGIYPQKIQEEKTNLEQAVNKSITLNRHHFLACRQPEDMQYLCEAGIEHDFTMAYADVAGFRLGTCRPVRYINPLTRQLTKLILHPMTIMECTLNDEKYMALLYEEALDYSRKLLRQVSKHNGEVVLLWHNTSATVSGGYLKQLYIDLLNELSV